jgi:hypothetical protein
MEDPGPSTSFIGKNPDPERIQHIRKGFFELTKMESGHLQAQTIVDQNTSLEKNSPHMVSDLFENMISILPIFPHNPRSEVHSIYPSHCARKVFTEKETGIFYFDSEHPVGPRSPFGPPESNFSQEVSLAINPKLLDNLLPNLSFYQDLPKPTAKPEFSEYLDELMAHLEANLKNFESPTKSNNVEYKIVQKKAFLSGIKVHKEMINRLYNYATNLHSVQGSSNSQSDRINQAGPSSGSSTLNPSAPIDIKGLKKSWIDTLDKEIAALQIDHNQTKKNTAKSDKLIKFWFAGFSNYSRENLTLIQYLFNLREQAYCAEFLCGNKAKCIKPNIAFTEVAFESLQGFKHTKSAYLTLYASTDKHIKSFYLPVERLADKYAWFQEGKSTPKKEERPFLFPFLTPLPEKAKTIQDDKSADDFIQSESEGFIAGKIGSFFGKIFIFFIYIHTRPI